MNDTLEAELRATYAERDAAYDPSGALERIRACSQAIPVQRRLRVRPLGALAALVGVGVAVVLGLGVGGGSSPTRVSTQQVIARIAAFVRGTGNGVLEVDSTTTTYRNGHALGSYTLERRSQERPPYDYWIADREFQEAVTGNTIVVYQRDFNQVSVGNLIRGPEPGEIVDPLTTAILDVGASLKGGSRIPGTAVDSPTLFARRLAQIIRGPNAQVDRNASFRGAPAISIRSADRQATLYVNPGNYRPLGLTVTNQVTSAEKQWQLTQKTVFKDYETLPEGSLDTPNIVLDHPHAAVAFWETTYWKRYWSRRTSGNAATRRQALRDLRNQ